MQRLISQAENLVWGLSLRHAMLSVQGLSSGQKDFFLAAAAEGNNTSTTSSTNNYNAAGGRPPPSTSTAHIPTEKFRGANAINPLSCYMVFAVSIEKVSETRRFCEGFQRDFVRDLWGPLYLFR